MPQRALPRYSRVSLPIGPRDQHCCNRIFLPCCAKRISVQAERLTYLVGFVFLFAFLIWITGFDILRGLSSGS